MDIVVLRRKKKFKEVFNLFDVQIDCISFLKDLF